MKTGLATATALLLAALSLPPPCAGAPVGPDPAVRIGVLDTIDPWFYVETFGPTMEHLRSALPGKTFQTEEMSFDSLQRAIKEGALDFFLAPSGFFAFVSESSGARHVATRHRRLAEDPGRSVGSVFVARAGDDRYQTVSDMRGAVVAATDPNSFEGWIIALGQLHGIDPDTDRFFRARHFTGYGLPDVATIVQNGDADVGILKACDLERMEAEGTVPARSLKVLGQRPPAGLACRVSTDLYPDVVFASLPKATSELVKAVSVALLTMPKTETGDDWGFAANFGSVAQLYRTLRLGPYAHLRDASLGAVLHRYRFALATGFGLLLAILLYAVSLRYLVRRRTKDLCAALAEKTAAEEAARRSRERLYRLEKAGVVNELSAMVAHEAQQPIASLINYADGLKMYLAGRGKDEMVEEAVTEISSQAERLSLIINRVRAYARRESHVREARNLREILASALETFRRGSLAPGVEIRVEEGSPCMSLLDPLEIELVAVNILRNAAAAMRDQPRKRIEILFRDGGGAWDMRFCDCGPKLSEERFAELARPVKSSSGLGLGLSICRVIVEAHGGHMSFAAIEPQGLAVSVHIPKLAEDHSVPHKEKP